MTANKNYPTAVQIKAHRLRCKLTQKQMADMLHRKERNIGQWEHGDRKMDPALWELFLMKTREN